VVCDFRSNLQETWKQGKIIQEDPDMVTYKRGLFVAKGVGSSS
jgi:hypothetical protein